jgi:hypothetical protein
MASTRGPNYPFGLPPPANQRAALLLLPSDDDDEDNEQEQPDPPPPYDTKAPPRFTPTTVPPTLHTYAIGGLVVPREVYVSLENKRSSVYSASFNMWSGPSVEVRRGDKRGQLVGTAKFLSLSRRIEIVVNGTGGSKKVKAPLHFDITKPELLGSQRVFELWGRRMAFKLTSQGTGFPLTKDLKLVDLGEANGSDRPWVIFRRTTAVSKLGRFEFQRPGLNQGQIDVIVLSTLAILEKMRRERSTRSSGAAANASVFAGASSAGAASAC